MICWICKATKRNLIRLWIDDDFRNICEHCRTTRVQRDPRPYGDTKTIPV